MTIIVGETERAALKAEMARAHTHPVPWEVLQRGIVDRSDAVHVEDRPATHKRPSSEFVDLPFGYVVAIKLRRAPGRHVPARVGVGTVAAGGAEYRGIRARAFGVVDAEDALIAALKVKMQRPEALIAYVRQQNKRGDTRHPMRRLSSENP